MYFSVGILRFAKGLDYSILLADDVPKSCLEVPRSIVPNDSSADLKIHGSLDSLRNDSQGKSLNCLITSFLYPPHNILCYRSAPFLSKLIANFYYEC